MIDQPHDCLRDVVDVGEIRCTLPWLNSLIGFPSRMTFAMNIAMFKKLDASIKNCGSRKFRLAGDRYPALAKGCRAANAAERYTHDCAIVSELLHARS